MTDDDVTAKVLWMMAKDQQQQGNVWDYVVLKESLRQTVDRISKRVTKNGN